MLNVLIGANGAGKSNFVSIFKLLNGMNAHNIQSYIAQQGGPERILHIGCMKIKASTYCFTIMRSYSSNPGILFDDKLAVR